MTGMGRAQGEVAEIPLRLEIKSINHRFCDVNVRLPSKWMGLEIPIQQYIKKRLSRGKVDLFIFEDKKASVSSTEKAAFQNYYDYLQGIQDHLGMEGSIQVTDLLPGVNAWMNKDVNLDELWKGFQPLIDKLLEDLDGMRSKEGDHLKSEMLQHFENVAGIAQKIGEKAADYKPQWEQKLNERIEKKLEDADKLDPDRLHAEVVYYLDRMDITEELQRLASHNKQAQSFFKAKGPVGRKLDFLLQEFNREFNTIASKSQDSELAHLVVEAKSELEKIREQVQNVE